jgi:hypothetical protein
MARALRASAERLRALAVEILERARHDNATLAVGELGAVLAEKAAQTGTDAHRETMLFEPG